MARSMEIETRNLVRKITGFTEDEDNFQISFDFALSNFKYHKFLTVDGHRVQRSIEGVTEKFIIHNKVQEAEAFVRLCNEFLNQTVFEFQDKIKTDTHFAVLSLLLSLSQSPTNAVYTPLKLPPIADLEEKFDWTSYLLEGELLQQRHDFDDSPFSSDDEDNTLTETMTIFPVHTKIPSKSIDDEVSNFIADDKGSQKLVSVDVDNVDWLRGNLMIRYWAGDINPKPAEKSSTLNNDMDVYLFNANPLYTIDSKTTLTEYQIIREIIWLLCGSNDLFCFKWFGDKFQINPAVTVTHLINESLHSVLRKMATYGTVVQRLLKFVNTMSVSCVPRLNKALPVGETSEPTPIKKGYCISQTHQAFAVALSHCFEHLLQRLCEIERRVCLQEETFTLFSLIDELSLSLAELTTVNLLLSNGIEACSHMTNVSLQASRLLDVIYTAMIDADHLADSGFQRLKFLVPVWLKTCRPFIDIIDTWINDGTLVDRYKEFIVHRNDEVHKLDQFFWSRAFMFDCVAGADSSRVGGEGHWVPQFLVGVLKDIVLTGKSMQLLLNLGRLKDVAAIGNNSTNKRVPLYETYFANITSRLKELSDPISHVVVTIDNRLPEVSDVLTLNINDSPLLKREQLSGGNFNDFLLDANFAQIVNLQGPDQVRKSEHPPDNNSGLILTRSESQQIPIIESLQLTLARQGLHEHIAARQELVCTTLLRILTDDYHLLDYFTAIRCFYLMESGHTMYEFYTVIFEQISARKPWQDVSFLNGVLQETLCSYSPQHADRLFVTVQTDEDLRPSSRWTVNSINCFKLCYKVDSPIDVILTDSCMDKYNDIFQFLLQIKWVKYSLDQLRFRDLNRQTSDRPLGSAPADNKVTVSTLQNGGVCSVSSQSGINADLTHRIQLFRVKLHQFVNSLHNYIMTRTLHSLGLKFTDDLRNARDLDSVIDLHRTYLSVLRERCLLHKKVAGLKDMIIKIFNICLQFHDIWISQSLTISEDSLREFEGEFNRCIMFLSSMIGSVVSRGSFPHLELLAFALITCNQTASSKN